MSVCNSLCAWRKAQGLCPEAQTVAPEMYNTSRSMRDPEEITVGVPTALLVPAALG